MIFFWASTRFSSAWAAAAWSGRLPYGPYIALAAAIWVFVPAHLQEAWTLNLKFFGNLFSALLSGKPF